MTIQNKIILLITIVTTSYSVGRFTAPETIKEKIVKIEVEKKVEQKEQYVKETKKFNDKGKVVEIIKEVGKKETKFQSKRQVNTKEKEVKKSSKWSYLRAGASVNPTELNSGLQYEIGYGFQVFKSIGVEVNGAYNPINEDKRVGVGLVIKF